MDKQIDKIDKAIIKAEKALDSKKAKKDPEVKAGAEKVLKELKDRKEELLKIKEEKEAAEREVKAAKTEEAKKKAELRKLKAEKRYKKFMKAKDPINVVCNIIKAASGIAGVVALFVFASKFTSKQKFFDNLNYYTSDGIRYGGRRFENMNNSLKRMGKEFGTGLSYGQRYHSVVTEDTNYFPY